MNCYNCGVEMGDHAANFCDECSQKMWEESFMADSQKYTDAAIARGEAVHIFFQYDDKVGQTRISSWGQAVELFAHEKTWLRFLFAKPDGKTYAEDFHPSWF